MSKEKSLMQRLELIGGRLHGEDAILDLTGLTERAEIPPVDLGDDPAGVTGAQRDLVDAVELPNRARGKRLVHDASPIDRHRQPARLRQLETKIHTLVLLPIRRCF